MTTNVSVKQLGIASTVIGILLVVVWYLALFKPETHDLSQARKADAAAKVTLGNLNQNVAQLKGLEREIPADQAKYAEYQLAIPSSPELSASIRDIQAAANSTDVSMSSLAPTVPTGATTSSPSGVSGAVTIPVTLTGTGTYSNLMAFVTALNSMPRTLVVQSLEVSGSTNQMTASISASMFYVGAPSS